MGYIVSAMKYHHSGGTWSAWICLAAVVGSWHVLEPPLPEPRAETKSVPPQAEKLSQRGLENLWMLPLNERQVLYSGGQPEGDEGFQALADLGVRTVISVDGARPDIELAKHHGLRYVHLPISYHDVPPAQLARMVQAVQSLPGPAYVHCHHGKHRGPASALSIWRCLNPALTPEVATETLKEMGTAAKYRGLYRAVERNMPAIPKSTTADFPEVTPAAPLAEQMVAIDLTWEQIVKLAKTSEPTADDLARLDEQWTHLAELFRESARLFEADSKEQRYRLRELLADSAAMLVPDEKLASSQAMWDWQTARIPQIESRCAACHAEFRD